jgi:UDP-glucose 4-epimerase
MLNRKQVVIGGFGFIGSNLVRELSRKSEVLCIDDLSNSIPQELIEALISEGNVEAVFRDINDPDVWVGIKEWCGVERVDIWHLAANSDIRAGGTSPKIDFDKTLQTTVSVIEICSLLEVEKLIFASTSAVYGEPINPKDPLSEESQCNPISYYGSAKLASELFLNVQKGFSNIQQYHFRFANIVGSPATHGLVFDVLNHIKSGTNPIPILGNGNQQKSYLEVNELISQMLAILKTSKVGTYNVGPGDNGVSVREIAELIRDHAAPKLNIQYQSQDFGWPGDVPVILLDTTKVDKFLDNPMNSSLGAVHLAVHQICDQLKLRFECDS